MVALNCGRLDCTMTPSTLETERQHRLEHLAGACRVLARLGMGEGILGHITVRDPEKPDLLWLNPMGLAFSRIQVSDLVQVNHQGDILKGSHPVNQVGVRLHSALHEARPEVMAVCHMHTQYGKAWSSLGRLLDPISQDACLFHGRQALIREPRLANTRDDAARFAASFGDHRVGIQVGHGLFTTGLTVDEATWWFISMERACEVQLLAEAAGTPEHWPDEMARGLAAGLGSSGFGHASFKPFWDEICASDPDLFD